MKGSLQKFTIKTLFITAVIYAGQSYAGQAEIDMVEQAANRLDVEALSAMSQTLTGYDHALNQYRLALSANLTEQPELAKTAIDSAIDKLELLNDADPNNVEIKALLAQVYGYKIALEPIKGIYYRPKSMALLKEAETIAPNNPRVLLVKGISALSTPVVFGGSEEVAFKSLNQALSVYPADVYSDHHWGYAEAYTWRGLVYQKRGEIEKAKADWQQALVLSPNYGWAKANLAKL